MGELIFIGLGLYDEMDITLKGLEEARSCDTLFAEFYTSRLLGTTIEKLTDLHGREIRVLTREDVEGGDQVMEAAKKGRAGFLVPGDPMAATTHVDLRLRAARSGVLTRLVAGVSSMTAVAGALGLQAYKFGRTTTLPYPEEGYRPVSPYEVLASNHGAGLHSLALLDIKEDRYMTAREGMEYLLACEEELSKGVFGLDTLACIAGRLGSSNPSLRADSVRTLLKEEFGPPLHVIVIPGKLHFMELECLKQFAGLPENLARALSPV